MLREIVEEVNLSPILRVKSSKSERIFKPSNNVNYDITILDQHPDLNSGLFKNMNHPPRDKEYMKIEVFNTDEKKALKTLKSVCNGTSANTGELGSVFFFFL